MKQKKYEALELLRTFLFKEVEYSSRFRQYFGSKHYEILLQIQKLLKHLIKVYNSFGGDQIIFSELQLKSKVCSIALEIFKHAGIEQECF